MIPPFYEKSKRYPNQWSYMLAWLRDAGPAGVHTFSARRAFVGNPSERIAELEAMGHVVSSHPERPAPGRAVGARYRLMFDADTGRHLNLDPGANSATAVVSLPPKLHG